MKVVTANVNGIRSAKDKGFFDWIISINPDVICLQEIKADLSVIPEELKNFADYYCTYYPAQKKGYSGVAILAKQKPDNIIWGLNNSEIDDEGRYLEFQFGKISIISLYLPSGSSGEDKQQKKFRFMDYYMPILEQQHQDRDYIICGDWNIAHQEIDLKNWKGNLKNSGFLPEERAWLTKLLANDYHDVWRTKFPEDPGYTWWSNRGQAYIKNVGWRIDYQIVSQNIMPLVIDAYIYKDQKFSDHAPLIVDYDLSLHHVCLNK